MIAAVIFSLRSADADNLPSVLILDPKELTDHCELRRNPGRLFGVQPTKFALSVGLHLASPFKLVLAARVERASRTV